MLGFGSFDESAWATGRAADPSDYCFFADCRFQTTLEWSLLAALILGLVFVGTSMIIARERLAPRMWLARAVLAVFAGALIYHLDPGNLGLSGPYAGRMPFLQKAVTWTGLVTLSSVIVLALEWALAQLRRPSSAPNAN